MKWKPFKDSPESYVLWGFIGFFVIWVLAGLLYSTRLNIISAIFQGFWRGLIFGGVPVWLAGLIKYNFLSKKPFVVLKAYNGHIEGEIQYFKKEENLESRIKKLADQLDEEKLELQYNRDEKRIIIDYTGGIEVRTKIFNTFRTLFNIDIKLEKLKRA
jgi:hypothetical protein